MATLRVVDSLVPQKPKEARWWESEAGGKVHCYLCPRHCHIGEGQSGFCFIRVNQGGTLYNLGYAQPAAIQIDPIEKKPLNHFLPGTKVFSMGTAGCNMGCFFCQNWDISKSRSDQVNSTHLDGFRLRDVPVLAEEAEIRRGGSSSPGRISTSRCPSSGRRSSGGAGE